MRRIFWGFCRNWFLIIDPLHYLSSRSDFGFEFAEIFVIEKGLPDSASRGVADSAFECSKENSASRFSITNTGISENSKLKSERLET
jgi:hypothetical protein